MSLMMKNTEFPVIALKTKGRGGDYISESRVR